MKEAWMEDASGVEMEADALTWQKQPSGSLSEAWCAHRGSRTETRRGTIPLAQKARGWSKDKKSGSVLHVTSRLAADPPER